MALCLGTGSRVALADAAPPDTTAVDASKASSLASEIATLEAVKANQAREVDAARTRLEDLQRKRDLEAADLDKLIEKKSIAETEAIQRKASLTQLDGQMATARSDLDDANKKLQTALTNIIKKNQELETINKEIEKRTRVLQALSDKGSDQIAEYVEVLVGGQSVPPRGTAALLDTSEGCTVSVRLRAGVSIGTLKGAHIERLTMERYVNHSSIHIDAPNWTTLDAREAQALQYHLCDQQRAALENFDVLELRISFKGAKDEPLTAVYSLIYQRKQLEFTIGGAAYVAGGDLTHLETRKNFAVFPALRIGLRINFALGNDNRAFFLHPSVLPIGFGFNIVDKSTERNSTTGREVALDTADAKTLGYYSGLALGFGRFVEVGVARDWQNQTTLFLLGSGQMLPFQWSP
jgi:hypothetical protein